MNNALVSDQAFDVVICAFVFFEVGNSMQINLKITFWCWCVAVLQRSWDDWLGWFAKELVMITGLAGLQRLGNDEWLFLVFAIYMCVYASLVMNFKENAKMWRRCLAVCNMWPRLAVLQAILWCRLAVFVLANLHVCKVQLPKWTSKNQFDDSEVRGSEETHDFYSAQTDV